MHNAELYAKCLDIASRPRKGMCYNYDSLLVVAEDLFPDTLKNIDKVNALLAIFDKSASSIYGYPVIDGKVVKFSPGEINLPTEKTPPPEFVIELADKYYAAAIKAITAPNPERSVATDDSSEKITTTA